MYKTSVSCGFPDQVQRPKLLFRCFSPPQSQLARPMRISCVNDALVATVAAVAVVGATAFVSVPNPAAGNLGSLPVSQSLASSTTRTGIATTVRSNHSRVYRCCSRRLRRESCSRLLSRTRLFAEADGPPPGGNGGGIPGLPDMKTVVETAEEEEQRAIREWRDDGRKGRVLVRRKEIPAPDKTPAAVCQLLFKSLQNNDDPMLDYGAAVAVKFASSTNAIRGMTPGEYGAFLRNDPEQSLLIDNASCRPTERAKVSADGKRALQKVELVAMYPDETKRIVEVQLTKEDDECWRVDAISFAPLG